MNMKKMMTAAILGAAVLGLAGTADAATGIVNVQAILSQNAQFQKAGKEVAAEQEKLQKQFNDQSKNMNDKDKAELAQKLNQQLADKENKAMKPVQDKFKAAVEKAAKAKNVDTVVAPGGLLYGQVDVDLTEDVQANMK